MNMVKNNHIVNKEFIPYEQALALKELGFDEPCFKNYNGNATLLDLSESIIYKTKAPLYQQAFRFFREKYKLEGLVLPQNQGAVIDGEPIYFIAIISYENEKMKELFNSTNEETMLHYNPREEAELACLVALIEIVKKK